RAVLSHRLLASLLGLAIVACSVPLYGAVKQEYIPSDVDEAEFEVRVTAPLNSSISAMDSVMRRVDEDIRSVRGVTTVLVDAGGGFIGGVNQGKAFVLMEPH